MLPSNKWPLLFWPSSPGLISEEPTEPCWSISSPLDERHSSGDRSTSLPAVMASVRGLRVSVKHESASDRSDSDSDSDSDQNTREAEPMEVEEGELESIPVRRSLKELLPVSFRL